MAGSGDPPASKPGHAKYDVLHSPFLELQTPFTWWEGVKLVLLVSTIIPRVAIALVTMLLLALCSYTASYNWPEHEPLSPARRRLTKAAARLAIVPVWMMGFRVRVVGYENVSKAQELGAIGVFNHSAYLDAFLMMALLAPSGVSKDTNARLPLIGTCIKAFKNIYVSSGKNGEGWTGAPRENLSQRITQRARDRRFPMLVMAPEGTCGDGRCVLAFRTGAFVPGAPVLPILITYNTAVHNPAWTIIYEAWHWLRMMTQPSNWAEVRFLPPYVPSAQERSDPRLYAANVRALFARELALPMVDQGAEEFRALCKAGVYVSWDGRRVCGPPGVLDASGRYADLTLAAKKRA